MSEFEYFTTEGTISPGYGCGAGATPTSASRPEPPDGHGWRLSAAFARKSDVFYVWEAGAAHVTLRVLEGLAAEGSPRPRDRVLCFGEQSPKESKS